MCLGLDLQYTTSSLSSSRSSSVFICRPFSHYSVLFSPFPPSNAFLFPCRVSTLHSTVSFPAVSVLPLLFFKFPPWWPHRLWYSPLSCLSFLPYTDILFCLNEPSQSSFLCDHNVHRWLHVLCWLRAAMPSVCRSSISVPLSHQSLAFTWQSYPLCNILLAVIYELFLSTR